MAIVDLNLYVKYEGEWSKPIFGTGGNILVNAKGGTSDEGYKMAYTDALGIACKALGIGADIWFGQDKTKYTNPNTEDLPFEEKKPKDAPKEAAPKPPVCENCGNPITPYTGIDGTEVSVSQHVKRCGKVFGHVYCYPCIRDNKLPNASGQE